MRKAYRFLETKVSESESRRPWSKSGWNRIWARSGRPRRWTGTSRRSPEILDVLAHFLPLLIQDLVSPQLLTSDPFCMFVLRRLSCSKLATKQNQISELIFHDACLAKVKSGNRSNFFEKSRSTFSTEIRYDVLSEHYSSFDLRRCWEKRKCGAFVRSSFQWMMLLSLLLVS